MDALGDAFRPWRHAEAIADGPAILQCIRETADEASITPHIHCGHRVRSAAWHSADACWTVQLQRAGGIRIVRTRFLSLCSGNSSDAGGHWPRFAENCAACPPRQQRSGALPMHADDQADVVADAGTLACGLEQDAGSPDRVLVGPGGGGLIGAIATWFTSRGRVHALEPVGAPALHAARAAGTPVDADVGGLAADAPVQCFTLCGTSENRGVWLSGQAVGQLTVQRREGVGRVAVSRRSGLNSSAAVGMTIGTGAPRGAVKWS